jgi:Coenzyme PQQ synthesis protein D (PqqD)
MSYPAKHNPHERKGLIDPMTQSHYPSMALGIEIKAVGDGYVVHQPDRDRVHHLNATAALILELCNGRTPAAELPELVQLAFGLPIPPVER